MIRAIQQFQLRTVLGSEQQAKETLRLVKEAGYEGIELNGFMIRKMPLMIRALTRMAGMPMGKSGHLDWRTLIKDSGLKVVAIHEDLGGILRDAAAVAATAKDYGTDFIVLTGMHRFDFSDLAAVTELTGKLNTAGEHLAKCGIQFLYHNHNCEFLRVSPDKTAYQLIVEETDPQYVGFEFDSYWPTEAGVDTFSLMKSLGTRVKLWHINDRGSRVSGPVGSILKSDSMELGYGNMNLPAFVHAAQEAGVQAAILESHKNWVDKSPVKSFQLSAEFMKMYVK